MLSQSNKGPHGATYHATQTKRSTAFRLPLNRKTVTPPSGAGQLKTGRYRVRAPRGTIKSSCLLNYQAKQAKMHQPYPPHDHLRINDLNILPPGSLISAVRYFFVPAPGLFATNATATGKSSAIRPVSGFAECYGSHRYSSYESRRPKRFSIRLAPLSTSQKIPGFSRPGVPAT